MGSGRRGADGQEVLRQCGGVAAGSQRTGPVERDGGKLAADEALAVSESFFGGESAESGDARSTTSGGTGEAACGSAQPEVPGRGEKGKQVEIAEGQSADESERLFKFLCQFRRESRP